jgi:hypothetical protein
MSGKGRTPQEWAEWFEGFKKRWPGAFQPKPPADAPPPPKPHTEPDDERRSEEER